MTAYALAPRQVHDHIGGRERDDQVAERHRLLTERNDVAEHPHGIAGALEMARPTQLDEPDIG